MHSKRVLEQGKGDLFLCKINTNKHRISSMWFSRSNRALEGTSKGLVSASDEHRRTQQGPNADLRKGRRGTHGCGRAAEVRHRSLVRVRLMQRPESVKTRGSTAAAELRGWRREEDEEERHEGEKRNDPSVLFIRQKDMCQARQSRGHETELSPRFPPIY